MLRTRPHGIGFELNLNSHFFRGFSKWHLADSFFGMRLRFWNMPHGTLGPPLDQCQASFPYAIFVEIFESIISFQNNLLNKTCEITSFKDRISQCYILISFGKKKLKMIYHLNPPCPPCPARHKARNNKSIRKVYLKYMCKFFLHIQIVGFFTKGLYRRTFSRKGYTVGLFHERAIP